MKIIVRNIFIGIIIFLVGYYLGLGKEDNKNIYISGTYLYENKRTVNVQTDTYFTIDSVNNEYVYYNEDNKFAGKIKRVSENLYLLNSGNLDKNIISFEDEKIVIIDKDGKVQRVYKFSDTLTEKK